MKVDGAVTVLVHLLELGIDLLLVYVITKPSQQKLEGAASDVARVISIVHLENLLELLYLLDFVGIEALGILLLLLSGQVVRSMRPIS